MKRLFIALFITLAATLPVHAVTLYTNFHTSFSKNQTRDIAPFNITAQTEGEITAANGIDLFFPAETEMLWDAMDSLAASGSAVDNGKISATIIPIYKELYTILHIPVTADFAIDETVTIMGIRIRAYRQTFRERYVQIDLNGDGVTEGQDVNKVEVQDTQATDHTPPYPPMNLTVTLGAALSSVNLSWDPSPDYDVLGVTLGRIRTRNGVVNDKVLFERKPFTSYEDTDVQEGDKITYYLYAQDERNLSERIETIVLLETGQEPPPLTPEPDEPEPPAPSPEDPVLAKLSSLYNYYKIRHEIKCLGPNATPASSLCLWAKIDLVYAQELLNRDDVAERLTSNDIYLMTIRVKWPEMRYQEKCVEADTPDKTCPALERSLQRVHYFID